MKIFTLINVKAQWNLLTSTPELKQNFIIYLTDNDRTKTGYLPCICCWLRAYIGYWCNPPRFCCINQGDSPPPVQLKKQSAKSVVWSNSAIEIRTVEFYHRNCNWGIRIVPLPSSKFITRVVIFRQEWVAKVKGWGISWVLRWIRTYSKRWKGQCWNAVYPLSYKLNLNTSAQLHIFIIWEICL